MGLRNLLKRDGARYRVLRKMVWADGVAVVGQTIVVSDPGLARELVGAGKIAALDEAAEQHLRRPARWTMPRDTSIHPGRTGVFSRKNPWRAE